MMKYVLLIILCYVSSYGFTQSNTNDTIVTAKTSFKGRHCRGTHGLCNMDNNARAIDSNTSITYDDINNTIVLQINRPMLSQEEEFLILRENLQNSNPNTQIYYLMEDDFIIPDMITQQLQIGSEGVTINRGTYPLIISDDTITISFKLE
ncbi:MAG: hypothetical protein ACI9Y7_000905 [Dokdonia sp.]|jgi:hypothetical protein